MNKVILHGRLCADPDVRYSQTQNGEQMAIARYRLVVNRKGKDARADFINCVAFGRQGEFAEKYLHKGQEIAVVGRIQTGDYTNKEGQKVYTWDVVIEEHDFCGTKTDSSLPQPSLPQPSPEGWSVVPEGIEGDLPFH